MPEKAKAVLALFDLDGDGELSASELATAATLLSLQKRQMRRLNIGLCIAFLVVLLLSVSNAIGTFFVTFTLKAVDVHELGPTRPLVAAPYTGAPSALTAKDTGGPVLTGDLIYSMDVPTLPHLATVAALDALNRVTLFEQGGGVRGFAVEGYLWHNRSALTLYLSSSYVLDIFDGILDLRGDASAGRRALSTHGRNLDWCVCCCTFTSGHAHTTVSNTGVGTANVGAGNGNSASIADGNSVGSSNSVASGDSATSSSKHWWR